MSGEKTGGRVAGTPNKTTTALRTYAGQYTEEAIEGLVAIARSAKTPHAACVAALREVLDRGVGRPPQALTADDEGGCRFESSSPDKSS